MQNQEFVAKLSWILFFYVFICNIIKVKFFVSFYCIVIFNLFFFTYYNFARSIAYASIESIDCILLSSFELKAILLISPVKTLCLSFLNCCVFNINLLFLMNSLCFLLLQKKVSISIYLF